MGNIKKPTHINVPYNNPHLSSIIIERYRYKKKYVMGADAGITMEIKPSDDDEDAIGTITNIKDGDPEEALSFVRNILLIADIARKCSKKLRKKYNILLSDLTPGITNEEIEIILNQEQEYVDASDERRERVRALWKLGSQQRYKFMQDLLHREVNFIDPTTPSTR